MNPHPNQPKYLLRKPMTFEPTPLTNQDESLIHVSDKFQWLLISTIISKILDAYVCMKIMLAYEQDRILMITNTQFDSQPTNQ